MTLNEQLQQLLDREAIRDLPARYANCMWQKDAAAAAALFVEDGVMQAGAQTMRGRAAIAAGLGAGLAGGSPQPFVHNVVVTLDGDRAAGVAQLDLRATVNGKLMAGTGSYEDTYVRTSQGWLFESRKLTTHGMVPLGA